MLPKDYARQALDKQRLGQLIDLISNIKVGDQESRSKDVLGRVYEYFLSQFARAEGKKGGELLPGQLFYSTQIPACLWFLARDKKNGKVRDRRGHVLFIDARKLGRLVDRTHRELTDDEVARIARTYHAWRGEQDAGTYEDVSGFCKSATLDEVRKHGHVLTPGRYVGAEAQEDDGEPFEEKMKRLATTLEQHFAEGRRLDAEIRQSLSKLGFTLGSDS